MNKQRGIISLVSYLIAAALFAALIAGGVIFWNRFTSSLVEEGSAAGKAACKAEYDARDNIALQAANLRIKTLEEQRRAEEAKRINQVAAISRNYQKELANVNAKKDSDMAAARSGDLVLLLPAIDPAGTAVGSGGAAGAPAAGTAGRNAGAVRELPREVAANLLAIADDADSVAKQLAACQEIVKADRN